MNAPWNAGKLNTRDPFIAFVSDETTAETLRSVAVEMGFAPEKVNKGGLRNAVQTLSVSASPNILLVDLSESGDPLNDINALAEVCEPGTVVIAVGMVNDVRLYRDLVASGIQDYLLKPLNPELARDALANAQIMLSAPKLPDNHEERAHCAVAVVGTRGGAGASTIATSLAWLMSEKHGRSTALLDLDVHFGTGALALDLEPGRGLTDAIENPSRIDGLFMERALVRSSEHLAVLSAEAPIHTPIMTDGGAFYQLQEEMRAAFECMVMDLPRGMLVLHPHLMTEIQIAVIVTEFTLAAARDSIRLLSWFKSNAPHTHVVVVANRVHPAPLLEISRKDFEQSIERKVDHVIPFDQKLAVNAAKLGKPMAAAGKGSKTVAPLVDLADSIIAMADEAAGTAEDTPRGKAKGKSKAKAEDGTSLLGKLAALKPKGGRK